MRMCVFGCMCVCVCVCVCQCACVCVWVCECRLFFFLSFFFLRRTLSFFLSFFLSFTELVKSQIHGIQIHERLLALDWNPAAGTFVSSGVRLCHGMYVCYFVVSNRYLTLKGPWVAMDEPRMSQGLRTHHVSSPTYDFELSTLKKLEFKAVSQMVLTLRLIEFTFHRVTVLFCYRLSHRQWHCPNLEAKVKLVVLFSLKYGKRDPQVSSSSFTNRVWKF